MRFFRARDAAVFLAGVFFPAAFLATVEAAPAAPAIALLFAFTGTDVGIGAAAPVAALVQKFSTLPIPRVVAALVSRWAAAVAWPRARPITAFAPDSHMLMNGFFLVQGFFMQSMVAGCASFA